MARRTPTSLDDLDRKLRPVGSAYKRLIEQWCDVPLLPNGPLTLLGPTDEPQGRLTGKT